MFRASIHTSFVENNMVRLTREEIDGACNNEQYPSDFFIDLIFLDARNLNKLKDLDKGSNTFKKKFSPKKSPSKIPPEEENKG